MNFLIAFLLGALTVIVLVVNRVGPFFDGIREFIIEAGPPLPVPPF